MLVCSDKDGKKVNNYPVLDAPITVIEGVPGQWDENKPHTMSIVEANMDGYSIGLFTDLHIMAIMNHQFARQD
jgi:hypothetical protein